MKTFANLIVISLTTLSAIVTYGAERAKPNIVLIFTDDHGWKDAGYQGGNGFETPNLDRLASEGMIFTNAYAAAGNCEPSRACLLTGTYTPRHGVFAVNSTSRGARNEMRLVPIPNANGLRSEHVTIAETLKEAGYVTGIFGKWQLDRDIGVKADKQGFDVVFQSEDSWGKVSKDASKNDENPKGIFSLTKAACDFIENNQNRPFFVYLPHYAIHVGLQARKASLEKFKSKNISGAHSSPLYLANTFDMDEGVGAVMRKLKELDLEDNTLVVFTSDNGGTQDCVQDPLRGSKGSYYEGGIREPFIIRWPRIAKPGSCCDVPVISQDLFPTFLAAAVVAVPVGKILDGESLLPLFRGGTELQRNAIFWHFPGYLSVPVPRGRERDVRGGFRSCPVSVIRKGDWKLHLFLEEWVLDGGRENVSTNDSVELYNLKDDLGEYHNLANTNTAKRDELLGDLLAWHKSVNAPIPTEPNRKYSPGNEPNGKKSGSTKAQANSN